MGDEKCPKCRGPLKVWATTTDGEHTSLTPWCEACDWDPSIEYSEPSEGKRAARDAAKAALLAACEPLAYWEPRDRLPTPEEEAAHTARHGAGAGWALLVLDVSGRWVPGDLNLTTMQRAQEIVAAHGEDVQCYAHVNGRPVGWP